MEGLSIFDVMLYLLIQFAIYYPSGHLLLNNHLKNLPFIIKFPILVSLGLVVNSILFSIIGVIYVGEGILLVLTVAFYGILFFKLTNLHFLSKSDMIWLRSHNLRILIEAPFKFGWHSIKSLRIGYNFWSLLFFVLVIGHFSIVGGYMGWPPGVDAINSGILTSILVNNHKLQTNLSPIAASQPWFEPIGVPVMSANLAFLFNLFPGEALLLFASTVISLILMSIYSIVYIMTKSVAFSSLALFSGFYIYPATSDIRFLEKWLIGFYYNTPYPTLFGYLALLVFIVCWLVVTNGYAQGQGIKSSKLSKVISVMGITVAYTPFVILPSIYIILSYVSKRLQTLKSLFLLSRTMLTVGQTKVNSFRVSKSRREVQVATVVGMLIAAALVVIIINSTQFDAVLSGPVAKLVERIHANSYYYSGVVLTKDNITNLTGIWTLIVFASSIFSLVKKNRSELSMFYLLFSSFIITSSLAGDIINDYVWFLFHGRLFAFLMILNWIMIAIYLSDLVNSVFLKTERGSSQSRQVIPMIRITVVLALSSSFFLPSLVSNMSLEQAQLWNWIFGSKNFENDYALLAWIAQNVNSSDLVMTDYSYVARSIHSFSLKNVTTHPFPNSPAEIEMDRNNAIVWSRPTLLRDFVERYDVRYILLDSEPYHRVPPEVSGDDEYNQRAYDINQYREIFSHMPFLKIVKQVGESTIYKVLSEEL